MAVEKTKAPPVAAHRPGGGKGEPADVKMRMLTRLGHGEFGTPEPGDIVSVREPVAAWLVKFSNAERVRKGSEPE